MSSDVGWHINYQGQAETNAWAWPWFNKSLRARKSEGSLGRPAQDGHLDSHTAPELWVCLIHCDLLNTVSWLGVKHQLTYLLNTVHVQVPTFITCQNFLRPNIWKTCALHAFSQPEQSQLLTACLICTWDDDWLTCLGRFLTNKRDIFSLCFYSCHQYVQEVTTNLGKGNHSALPCWFTQNCSWPIRI